MIRLTLLALVTLSTSGCVAAIPLAMQLVSSPNAGSQLCSAARIPGQTASLCDRFTSSTPAQPQGKVVNTATR
jgi:hypothetical protein